MCSRGRDRLSLRPLYADTMDLSMRSASASVMTTHARASGIGYVAFCWGFLAGMRGWGVGRVVLTSSVRCFAVGLGYLMGLLGCRGTSD